MARKLLLDTSVVIPVEPTHADEVEPTTEVVALLFRRCQQLGVQVFVHPQSLAELRGDRDLGRKEARSKLVLRYLLLDDPPGVSLRLASLIGTATAGSHDYNDDLLLAAVFEDAVDYLVTSDAGLLKKGDRAGLSRRVGSPESLLRTLEAQVEKVPPPPPAVNVVRAYALRQDDPIFDSLRADYSEFDTWLAKCRLEHRHTWVICHPDGTYSAVAIVKEEQPSECGLPGRSLKVSTFKVDFRDTFLGYGELLLKSLLHYADANGFDHLYLAVLPKHRGLLRFLETFGFEEQATRSPRGEYLLAKRLVYSDAERLAMSSLDYAVRAGPPRLKLDEQQPLAYVIPIQPGFHELLFPEAEDQLSLLAGQRAFGNAIRKAYLCHGNIGAVQPGALLLFYRSETHRHVKSLGIAEGCCRSSSAEEILAYVGTRTVYSVATIEGMCSSPVLAVLFRHHSVLTLPWSLDALTKAGVVNGPPQSIMQVPPEGISWLRKSLAQSS